MLGDTNFNLWPFFGYLSMSHRIDKYEHFLDSMIAAPKKPKLLGCLRDQPDEIYLAHKTFLEELYGCSLIAVDKNLT